MNENLQISMNSSNQNDYKKAWRREIEAEAKNSSPPKEKHSLDSVIEKIRHMTLIGQVRIEEFMRDFDHLKSGTISHSQFWRGLSAARIMIPEDEMEVLSTYYRCPHKLDHIRWREFVDEVDKIFTEKNLEKEPSKNLTFSSPKQFAETVKVKICSSKVEDEEKLQELLSALKFRVHTRRTFMKPLFQDFDPHHRGKITESNFIRCMDKICTLKDYEFKLLRKAYYEPATGYVNYFKFLEDMDASEVKAKVPEMELSYSLHWKDVDDPDDDGYENYLKFTIPKEVRAILEKVRSTTTKNRIRVKEFFEDHDPLRKGYITRNKFRAGLSMANLELTEGELTKLENHFDYTDEYVSHHVYYQSFCEFLESAFTENGLEKCPTKKLADYHPMPRFPKKKETISENACKALDAVLHKLSGVLKSRKVLLIPHFRDYDPLRKERVTKTQFMSTLDFLKLKISEKDMKCLREKYEDFRGDMDYVSFCNDLESVVPVDAPNSILITTSR